MQSLKNKSASWHAKWRHRRGSGDTGRKTKDPGKEVKIVLKDRGDDVIIELDTLTSFEDPYRSPTAGPSGLSIKPSRSYDSDDDFDVDGDDEKTTTPPSSPRSLPAQTQGWSDRSEPSDASPADDGPRVPGWKYSVQPPPGRRIAIARPVKRDPPEPEKPPPTLQDRVIQKGRDIASTLKYCVPGVAEREAERARLERANWAKEPTFGRGVKRERSPSPEPRQYGETRDRQKPCQPGCACHDAVAMRNWLKDLPPTVLERIWSRTPKYNEVRNAAARYWRRVRTRESRAQAPSGLSRLARGKKSLGNLRESARVWCQEIRRRERSVQQDPPDSALEPAPTGNLRERARIWCQQMRCRVSSLPRDTPVPAPKPAPTAAQEQLQKRKRKDRIRAKRAMKQLYTSDLSAFHLFYSRGLAEAGEPVRVSRDPYMRVYHQRESRRLDFTHRHKRARLSLPPTKASVLGQPCLCRPDFHKQGRCKEEARKLRNKPGPTKVSEYNVFKAVCPPPPSRGHVTENEIISEQVQDDVTACSGQAAIVNCRKAGKWTFFLTKMGVLFSIAITCIVLFLMGQGYTNETPIPIKLQREFNTYIDSDEPFKVFFFNNTRPTGRMEISLNGPFNSSSQGYFLNYQFERWYFKKTDFDRKDVRIAKSLAVEVNHSSHSWSSTYTEICPTTLHPSSWAEAYYNLQAGFKKSSLTTSPWPHPNVISVFTEYKQDKPTTFWLSSLQSFWMKTYTAATVTWLDLFHGIQSRVYYKSLWTVKSTMLYHMARYGEISASCYHSYSWLNISEEEMSYLSIIPGRQNFYNWRYKVSLFHSFKDYRQHRIGGRVYKHTIYANKTLDKDLEVIYAVKFAFNSTFRKVKTPFSVAFSFEVIEGDDLAYTTTTTTPAPAVTVVRGEGKWYLLLLLGLVFLLYCLQVDRALIVCTLGAACYSVMAFLQVRPPASEINKWIKFDHIVTYLFVMTFNAIVADTGLYDVIAIGITKMAYKTFYIAVFFLWTLTTYLAVTMDNVISVLLLTPIAIRTFEELQLKPQPMLISMIVLSNTASLLNENGNIFSYVLIEKFKENYQMFVLKNTSYRLLNFPGVCSACFITIIMVIGLTFLLFKRQFHKERTYRRAQLDHEDLLWYRLETSLPPGSANVDVLQRWFTEERHKIDRERRGIDPETPAVQTNRTIHDPDLLLRVGEVMAAFAVITYCKANNVYGMGDFTTSGICSMCTLLLLVREHTLKNTPFNAIVNRIALTPLIMMVALSVFGNTLLLLRIHVDIVRYLVNRLPAVGFDNWTAMISRAARDLILISAGMSAVFGDIAAADFVSSIAHELTLEISRRENITAFFYSLKPIFCATNMGANFGSSAMIMGSIAGFTCSALATQQGYHLGACRYMRIALPIAILNVMALFFLWVNMEPKNSIEDAIELETDAGNK